MQDMERLIQLFGELNTTMQKITDVNTANHLSAGWTDQLLDFSTRLEALPRELYLTKEDSERDREFKPRMEKAQNAHAAEMNRLRRLGEVPDIMHAALDVRLAKVSHEAVAKRMRELGTFVVDLVAIDRLTLRKQTIDAMQQLLDTATKIMDIAAAQRIMPDLIKHMSELSRLHALQPDAMVWSTHAEADEFHGLAARLDELTARWNGELPRIMQIPEVRPVFRAAVDAEIASHPDTPFAADVLKQREAAAAAMPPVDPNATARAEEFVTIVERSITVSEDITAVSRRIKDTTSAKKFAATWAKLTAESMELVEQQNKLAGIQLIGPVAERYQAAQRRDAKQGQDMKAEIARLQQLIGVMPILKDALDKQIAEQKSQAATLK